MLMANLKRASQLVKDFKQTAVNQVSESCIEFSVYQVLSALLASLHPETRKIPVTPRLVGDSELLMKSLPGVLTQIISNLVLNSVNHAFSSQTNPEIIISFQQDGEFVLFEYSDNGEGIDKSIHHKIFEPFFTSKRGKGGSGLGLNLVFNLLHQKLKGSLKFESELGQGVHFSFKIPQNLIIDEETPTA